MRTAVIVTVLAVSVTCAPVHAATSGSCKSAKAAAAGKKAAALLQAFGRNLQTADPVRLGFAITKAQARFTRSVVRADESGGCDTIDNAALLEGLVDAFVLDVVAEQMLRFVDHGDGTLTDLTTGLMWEQKDDNNAGGVHDMDTAYTWSQSGAAPDGTAFTVHLYTLNNRCDGDEVTPCTADDDCAGIGSELCGHAGYRDWRLPHVGEDGEPAELESLIDPDESSPMVFDALKSPCAAGCEVTSCSCTRATSYWAATVSSPTSAWIVGFFNGSLAVSDKMAERRVRAVRGVDATVPSTTTSSTTTSTTSTTTILVTTTIVTTTTATTATSTTAPATTTTTSTTTTTTVPTVTVFTSSASVNGAQVGGVPGAHGQCGSEATAAGLQGTYLAWISDGVGRSPEANFTHADVPYALPDGTLIANDWADLTDGTLLHPIDQHADGSPAVSAKVWTGTSTGGTAAGSHCQGWTSSSGAQSAIDGDSGQSDPQWTAGGSSPCSNSRYLYCFGQPTFATGPELQLNAWSTGVQQTAAVATAPDGAFTVVWADADGRDGNSSGIFGRRYDAAGVALSGDIQVNSYTTESQHEPAAAIDGAGNVMVVWTSSGQDGSGDGIFGQRYDSAGNPLAAEFQVNTYTTGSQASPSVAASVDGKFVVVWSSNGQDGSGYGIIGQRYDAAGDPAGGEFQINTYTTGSQSSPSVAADAEGKFLVAWTSLDQDGDASGIFGQRYDYLGAPIGGEFQVNSYTTGSQSNAAVATNPEGDVVVVWADESQDGDSFGVFGRRYLIVAGPVGAEFQINSFTAGFQVSPTVTVAADSGFVMAWQSFNQDGDQSGIFGQRYNALNRTVGGEFQVNSYTTGAQVGPAIAGDVDGDFVVVWTSDDQDGSDTGIFGQRFDQP